MLLSQLGRGLTGIAIHPGATVGRSVFSGHCMGVVRGVSSDMGERCLL